MKLNDRIFKSIEIKDQIIIDIIKTKPFQRLKEINQYGGVNFIFKESYQTTRYEHSIGVWYATMRLGADIETQVAALLHDVGHYAFSHLVDQAREDATESAHELSVEDLNGWDEIQKILEKNNLKLKSVEEYSLIKNSLPNIGTDRLDYAIRDLESVMQTGEYFGSTVLENINVIDGHIIFTNLEVAKKFASTGNKAMWHVIYDPQIAVIYQSIVEILRDGLTNNWITDKDLLGTDSEVFEIIKKNKNNLDSKYFRVFEEHYNTVIVQNIEDADFVHIKLKARYFDPLVLIENKTTKKVSELDSEFAGELKRYLDIFESAKKGTPIKVVY